ncbi:PfkB family carbohydrate kinase [Candidatus Omnitrophota bacterium]
MLDQLAVFSLGCNNIAIDEAHPTGTVAVKIGAEGKPSYTIHENVAWDYIPKTPQLLELAKRANAVSFGTLAQRAEVSLTSIQAFVNEAHPKALCIFDINLRQSFYSPEVIKSSLELSHVLKLNEEELAVVADQLSLDGDELTLVSKLARRYRLHLVALTKGEKGSLIYSKGQISYHHGYKVKVADTVGAGDSFTTALALGMLKGYSLDELSSHANRVAAFVCSRSGATPELPDELWCYTNRQRNYVKYIIS